MNDVTELQWSWQRQRAWFGIFLCGLALLFAGMAVRAVSEEPARPLFDGRTLHGWEVLDADKPWWRVEDGVIRGGSLEKKVPRNMFLATVESFQNFELKLKIRLRGKEGFINSGIQIRSIRIPGSSEMKGYQVDAGDGWWGKLYDESRRRKVIGNPIDQANVDRVVRPNDWNEYRIRAEGRRIRTWINGVPALDFVEQDKTIPLDGKIGLQVHGGGKVLVEFKDMTIVRLPPTPGAPTWSDRRGQPKKKAKEKTSRARARRAPAKVVDQLKITTPALSPQEEQRGFSVPDGFHVELVTAESKGIGKFVAIAFDAHGRLWTMTALEYPVDANENPEASRRLFAAGGRDKVLVIDDPYHAPRKPPRVFAEGLVMPLGILPYGHGVYVQYGHDIRFYRDTDGDGKSDRYDVILTGFGTQDSHLFPHQFTRVPGGSILMAQGLFNDSLVQRPDGRPFADGTHQVRFRHCKLARFAPDGSAFEPLTAGPNNIWGLTISRHGEIWIQEANDIGYPIIPFEPGGYYRTGSPDRLASYQPLMPPPLAPAQMGGTGLSGLALADDLDGWPAPWGSAPQDGGHAETAKVFYVANPITSRIQTIRATWNGKRYRYQKGPDFLTSSDPKFRPVSIQFGPDGCLYVVDWYNKIISHNEVPRNHPERDKRRGRIWRIWHDGQSREPPPLPGALPTKDLIAQLGAANARIAQLAWQEIVDRNARELAPALRRIVVDARERLDRRLGALWALEGLNELSADVLRRLARDEHAVVRYEAVRAAPSCVHSSAEFVSIAGHLMDDPLPRVRAALGNALRRLENPHDAAVELMVRLAREPIEGQPWEVYDRENERFLARRAMERHAAAVDRFLASPKARRIPLENRLVALMALPGVKAARHLAALLPELKRPLLPAEVRILAEHARDETVARELKRRLQTPRTRRAILAMLLDLRTALSLDQLRPMILDATRAAWRDASSDAGRLLALRAAGAFKLRELDEELAATATRSERSAAVRKAALIALRRIDTRQVARLLPLATDPHAPSILRREALLALGESSDSQCAAKLSAALPELEYDLRREAIQALASHRTGVRALLAAVESETLDPEEFSPEVLQTMKSLVPQSRLLKSLWSDIAPATQRVVRLNGNNSDYLDLPLTLEGPFTVETWIRLAPGISNADGILGAPGVLDANFHAARFRVWLAGRGDVVIADRKVVADAWTHVAISRDAKGVFRIYVNGERAGVSKPGYGDTFRGLYIGRTIPRNTGTRGEFIEYRIWNRALNDAVIRAQFDRTFDGESLPAGLVNRFSGSTWPPLHGTARVVATDNVPRLVSSREAAERAAVFDRYRKLIAQSGDPARGREVFTRQCLACHSFRGTGGRIGPPLDGIGAMSDETLLRHVLTPSAAMEGGYRNFTVLTRSGRIYQGLLVSHTADAVVLRRRELPDERIPKRDIIRAGHTSTSVMPEGILDSLPPEDVQSLFSYFRSLRPAGGAAR